MKEALIITPFRKPVETSIVKPPALPILLDPNVTPKTAQTIESLRIATQEVFTRNVSADIDHHSTTPVTQAAPSNHSPSPANQATPQTHSTPPPPQLKPTHQTTPTTQSTEKKPEYSIRPPDSRFNDLLKRLKSAEQSAEEAHQRRISETRRADEAERRLAKNEGLLDRTRYDLKKLDQGVKKAPSSPELHPLIRDLNLRLAASAAVLNTANAKIAKLTANIVDLEAKLRTSESALISAIKALEVLKEKPSKHTTISNDERAGFVSRQSALLERIESLKAELEAENKAKLSIEIELASARLKISELQTEERNPKTTPVQKLPPDTGPHPANTPKISESNGSIHTKTDLIAAIAVLIGGSITAQGIKKSDFISAMGRARALKVTPELEAEKSALTGKLDRVTTSGKWLKIDLAKILT